MLENREKGVKRNEGNISEDERPTKTPRIDGEEEVQTQDQILRQGQPIPPSSVRTYGKIEALGVSRISMDFEGENGRTLKQSFIESIVGCPTDLDFICSDGVAFAHRFILMGVSDLLFQLLRDRDMSDTGAITLDNVSIANLSLALELIYSGAVTIKAGDEEGLHELLDLLGIQMKLERKKANEEDLLCGNTLQHTEITIKIENDDDDKKMQTVAEENGNGGASVNEVEPVKMNMVNCSTVSVANGKLDEVIDNDDFDFGASMDDEGETGVNEVKSNPHHQVYRERKEVDTGESDSEVEEESDDDIDIDSDKQVVKGGGSLHSDDEEDNAANESGKDASNRNNGSGQNGEENENEVIDLTSDCEDDENRNRNASDGKAVASSSSSLDKSERRPRNPRTITVAKTRPGQFDLGDLTEGHITLNGKKIHWHLMEALPSLTSAELRSERMRVFILNIVKRPQASLGAEVRNLFKSLPENSLEKRLGMMAVECENYKEIDLVEILQPSKSKGVPSCQDSLVDIGNVELVGTPGGCANLVRKLNFDERNPASKRAVALRSEMWDNESARYNLMNYKKLIYENIPSIKQERLLEIRYIKGWQGRTKALIELNIAGRTVEIHRFMGPHFGWHEDYMKRSYSLGLHPGPELGGVGLDVCSMHGWSLESDVFILNVTGTQILFPMLVKDIHLVKKLEVEKIPSLSSYHGIAVSPKCLLENGISCFPVVQKPGMLIYKYIGDDLRNTCDISKLRLDMGAEMRL